MTMETKRTLVNAAYGIAMAVGGSYFGAAGFVIGIIIAAALVLLLERGALERERGA